MEWGGIHQNTDRQHRRQGEYVEVKEKSDIPDPSASAGITFDKLSGMKSQKPWIMRENDTVQPITEGGAKHRIQISRLFLMRNPAPNLRSLRIIHRSLPSLTRILPNRIRIPILLNRIPSRQIRIPARWGNRRIIKPVQPSGKVGECNTQCPGQPG